MSTIKVNGIVIKEVNVGESDKIITVLAKERGKLSFSARGARKPKSKFMAGTQLFCCSEFIVYDRRKFLSLTQVETLESFYHLRNDLEKLTYALHMMELVDKTILENDQHDDILSLMVRTLSVLAKTDFNSKLSIHIFEIKFMQFMGYTPVLDCCTCCGRNVEPAQNYFFSFSSGGIVCQQCITFENSVQKISHSIYAILNHIIQNETKNLFSFNTSESVLIELSKLTRAFIYYHLDIQFLTLDFLKEI